MSEAAKPADPERALARIASLERHAADALHDGMLRDVTAGDLQMLLPLARAGLGAANMQACLRTTFHAGFTLGTGFGYGFAGGSAKDAAFVPSREVRDEYWSKYVYRVGDAAIPALALEELKERDALRAEFAACVRALASLLGFLPCQTGEQNAAALSGPLAAAVLRSQGGEDAKNAQQGVKREPAPPAAAQAGASANAEAQEAIAEGAVLRSPEPATPADGGA